MREYLFRAKLIKNGEWAYGNLRVMPDNTYIITPNETVVGEYGKVNSETVGQYIGLTDKNGRKIFEGDIVHILGNEYVEEWKNIDYYATIVFIDGGYCAIDGTIEDYGLIRYNLSRMDFDVEVVGNIYDNPELLEKE